MNKRMKDPKGDLRFVHKSTRVYDFWSLKLTAMAYRQTGSFAPLREQKKECLPVRRGGLPRRISGPPRRISLAKKRRRQEI
jgi:hypothetical protein